MGGPLRCYPGWSWARRGDTPRCLLRHIYLMSHTQHVFARPAQARHPVRPRAAAADGGQLATTCGFGAEMRVQNARNHRVCSAFDVLHM